jgi:5'-3' exonuclease
VRDKMLYGLLLDSLEKSLESYSRLFPFDNIYLVSDSITNWRKKIYPEYKGTRKKDNNIDWDFVSTIYREFKENLNNRVQLYEEKLIEGDDWISYLTKKSNREGKSVLIISNDGDLKQLLTTGKDYINLMCNENNIHNYIYVPLEYKTWLAQFNNNIDLPSLFDESSSKDQQMYNFIKSLLSKREVKPTLKEKVLFEKIIGGDRGDNVKSVFIKNNRGIGEKTAEKIYEKYVEYFGSPTFDEECFNRMSDIVIEVKKLDSDNFDHILDNINFNNKIVNLNRIPKSVKKIMENYGQ